MTSWRAGLTIFILGFGLVSASIQKHEDSRCLCTCPNVSTVSGVEDATCNEESSYANSFHPKIHIFLRQVPDRIFTSILRLPQKIATVNTSSWSS